MGENLMATKQPQTGAWAGLIPVSDQGRDCGLEIADWGFEIRDARYASTPWALRQAKPISYVLGLKTRVGSKTNPIGVAEGHDRGFRIGDLRTQARKTWAQNTNKPNLKMTRMLLSSSVKGGYMDSVVPERPKTKPNKANSGAVGAHW